MLLIGVVLKWVLCKTTSERPQSFAGPFVWKTMDDHYV
jgi:hypothetical protein